MPDDHDQQHAWEQRLQEAGANAIRRWFLDQNRPLELPVPPPLGEQPPPTFIGHERGLFGQVRIRVEGEATWAAVLAGDVVNRLQELALVLIDAGFAEAGDFGMAGDAVRDKRRPAAMQPS